MIRVSKLTDYALVILAILAHHRPQALQANDIAKLSTLNLPTAAKLLKQLAKSEYVTSSRGVKGGYQLAIHPKQIPLRSVIELFEGPLAVVACSLGQQHCSVWQSCQMQAPWQQINQLIAKTLESFTLADMIGSTARIPSTLQPAEDPPA